MFLCRSCLRLHASVLFPFRLFILSLSHQHWNVQTFTEVMCFIHYGIVQFMLQYRNELKLATDMLSYEIFMKQKLTAIRRHSGNTSLISFLLCVHASTHINVDVERLCCHNIQNTMCERLISHFRVSSVVAASSYLPNGNNAFKQNGSVM